MTTKTDLRALMEDDGELTTLNERIMDAVQTEVNSGDACAGYLSITTQTNKDDPGRIHAILCVSGKMSALCAGVANFLKNNPGLIPAFEIALATTKSKSTQTAD
jgi:hypothetical protein